MLIQTLFEPSRDARNVVDLLSSCCSGFYMAYRSHVHVRRLGLMFCEGTHAQWLGKFPMQRYPKKCPGSLFRSVGFRA